jgi:hypothetical protein
MTDFLYGEAYAVRTPALKGGGLVRTAVGVLCTCTTWVRVLYEVPKSYRKRPPICEGCGVNRADPPSKLCPGCQAYQEHQR